MDREPPPHPQRLRGRPVRW